MNSEQSRDMTAFADAVRSTGASDAETIVATVENLLHWTLSHPALAFRPSSAKDQASVKTGLSGTDYIFWSAYPRNDDGAKLELGTGKWMDAERIAFIAGQLVCFGGRRDWRPGQRLIIPVRTILDATERAAFYDLLESMLG